jgi:glycosyltransferase involved in cell wall biosynthesis
MSAPAVSVVIPCFNRPDYLRAAVESVFAQTNADWELILVDDGSDLTTRDYLSSLAASPRVRISMQPHTGNPGAVRNAGVLRASGEFVAFLDSDDLWYPRKLATQLDLMRANPARPWSFSAVDHIDSAGEPLRRAAKPRRPLPCGAIASKLIEWSVGIATPSVMVRRDFFERLGGFDETQRMHEDFELWLRMALHGEVSSIATPLAAVRHHESHFSARGEPALRHWIELFERLGARNPPPVPGRALARQCVRCTVAIARLHAAQGNRYAALNALLCSRADCWRHRAWWLGAPAVLAAIVLPAPLRKWWRVHRMANA